MHNIHYFDVYYSFHLHFSLLPKRRKKGMDFLSILRYNIIYSKKGTVVKWQIISYTL